jgi:PBP1b-binding outer membrane lipoprotein LpoB
MKKRIFVISLSCLVALILAGCVTTLQSYKPKTPDEASIKELLLKW